MLGGALTAAAVPFEVTPQESTAAGAHEKVYKVGEGVTPPVLTHSVDTVAIQIEVNFHLY